MANAMYFFLMMKGLLYGLFVVVSSEVGFSNGENTPPLYDSGVHDTQRHALSSFYRSMAMNSSSYSDWFSRDEYSHDYCGFSGIDCDNIGHVIRMNVSFGALVGTLPTDIGSLSKLRALRTQHNNIRGTIPTAIGLLTDLQYLNVGHNLLEGTIPDFSNLEHLRGLLLDHNALSGSLPSSLCTLNQLATLDLSGITKMWGQIPECLGNLSQLSTFRIKDIALTGEIPSELCSTLPFGCDSIGCPVGFYHAGSGRQTSIDSPCLACEAPSNVIASTTCRWHDIATASPTLLPSDHPSASPTELYDESTEPSHAPMNAPSLSPSENPTMSSSGPTPSAAPSESPTLKESLSPTIPQALSSPATAILDPPKSGGNGRSKTLPIVLSLCALCCCAAFCAWKQKEAAKQHQYGDVDRPASKPLGDQSDSENVPDVELLVLAETPDTEETEGSPANNSDAHEQLLVAQRIPSILKRTALDRSSSEDNRSQADRRVRFAIPRSLSWSSGRSEPDEGNDDHSVRQPGSPSQDFEAWVSWILDPLSMGATNENLPAVTEENDDAQTTSSMGSSANHSESPLLGNDANGLLGIRDRGATRGNETVDAESLLEAGALVQSILSSKRNGEPSFEEFVEEGLELMEI